MKDQALEELIDALAGLLASMQVPLSIGALAPGMRPAYLRVLEQLGAHGWLGETQFRALLRRTLSLDKGT